MTERQVDIALREISRRQGKEFKVQAALHGVKLKEAEATIEPVKVDEKQQAEIDRISKMSVAERRKAFR